MKKIVEVVETQLLKFGSILMIFSSMVRFFFGLMFTNFMTASTLMGAISKGESILYRWASRLIFLGAALEMVVGIIGTMNCEEPAGARKCIWWGAATLVWTTACNLLQIYVGYGSSYVAWTTGTAIPGVFLLGAVLFCVYSRRRSRELHARYKNL